MIERVNHFAISSSILGTGNFSEVRLAIDTRTGEQVAVKVCKTVDKEMPELLNNEIGLWQLIQSPYVVRFLESAVVDDKRYIFMEFCKGGNLKEALKSGPFSEQVVRRLTAELIEVLSAMRLQNIIHRDLKPENILLTDPDPRVADVKVGDWGLCCQAYDCGLLEGQIGTPLFWAPEVLQNSKYTFKADVWSFGAVMYMMLTGSAPFKAKTRAQLMELQRGSLYFDPELNLSPCVVAAVLSMISIDPAQRPSFDDLKHHPFFCKLPSPDLDIMQGSVSISDSSTVNFPACLPRILDLAQRCSERQATELARLLLKKCKSVLEGGLALAGRVKVAQVLETHNSRLARVVELLATLGPGPDISSQDLRNKAEELVIAALRIIDHRSDSRLFKAQVLLSLELERRPQSSWVLSRLRLCAQLRLFLTH